MSTKDKKIRDNSEGYSNNILRVAFSNSNGKIYQGVRKDASTYSGAEFTPTFKFHCNVDGTYTITDSDGNTTNDLLVAGEDYHEDIINITNTDDSTVSANSITLHW